MRVVGSERSSSFRRLANAQTRCNCGTLNSAKHKAAGGLTAAAAAVTERRLEALAPGAGREATAAGRPALEALIAGGLSAAAAWRRFC